MLKRQHLDEQNPTKENDSIFLVSTLHRDNLSSKYVSEFFGLKDNLFVTRRTGRDREVHICKINKKEIKQYIDEIEKKLIVLYNYNPNEINVSDDERLRIIKEQLEYEQKELSRLERISNPKYSSYVEMKKTKIKKLNSKIQEIDNQREAK